MGRAPTQHAVICYLTNILRFASLVLCLRLFPLRLFQLIGVVVKHLGGQFLERGEHGRLDVVPSGP